MVMIEKTIALMGLPGTDKVTGAKGIISSVAFDLYGCVQVTLTPKADKDGKVEVGHWFDVVRIEVGKEKDRVLPVPAFDKAFGNNGKRAKPQTYDKGAAEKRSL